MFLGINISLVGRLKAGLSAYAIGAFDPPLVLDFIEDYYRTGGFTSTFGDALNFSRASAATYIDADGVLQTAAAGVPRVGHHVYNGSEWVNEGLLIESEARTNLITHSEDFTDASWSKGGVSQVTLNETGPDGVTNSAVTLSDDNSGGTGPVLIFETVTVSTSTTYTFSCFAKKKGLSWVVLRGESFTTPSNGGVYFNLNDGSIGTETSGFSGKIEDFGNGWYRCSISFTTDSSDTSGAVVIRPATGDGNLTVDLDGTSSILIYGAQLEQGPTPSSYIPTSGSTVTRGAESLTAPSANLPWSSSAVSIAMEGTMTYADEGLTLTARFWLWRENFDNQMSAYLDTAQGGSGAAVFLQERAGTTDFVISPDDTYSPGINVPFSIASRHGATFINSAVDGTALTADTTPTALPDLSNTDLEIAFDFMGTIKSLRIWEDDLGDSGISEVSS